MEKTQKEEKNKIRGLALALALYNQNEKVKK